MTRVPHFDFPMQVRGGKFAELEQGSDDEIAACVDLLLTYPLGSIPEAPDFGVAEEAFVQGGPNLGEIRAAVAAWVPRAPVHLELTDAYLTDAVARVNAQIGGDTSS